MYHESRWDNSNWMHISSLKLEIDDYKIIDLVTKIRSELAPFIDPTTGRLGNGLHLLFGGSITMACPTVEVFTRTIITAAVKLGAQEVANLLSGWALGELLRFRINALLESTIIDKELQLAEGIRVSKQHNSSAGLMVPVNMLKLDASHTEIIGGVIMSIDYEMSPAIYLPEEGDISQKSRRKGEFKSVYGKVPNLTLDSFCEAMSLASNSFVNWRSYWRDLGLLEAFSHNSSSIWFKNRSGSRKIKITQEDLSEGLKIHHALYNNAKPRKDLELSIHRWIESKRSTTTENKLIELRIALEALYQIK